MINREKTLPLWAFKKRTFNERFPLHNLLNIYVLRPSICPSIEKALLATKTPPTSIVFAYHLPTPYICKCKNHSKTKI